MFHLNNNTHTYYLDLRHTLLFSTLVFMCIYACSDICLPPTRNIKGVHVNLSKGPAGLETIRLLETGSFSPTVKCILRDHHHLWLLLSTFHRLLSYSHWLSESQCLCGVFNKVEVKFLGKTVTIWNAFVLFFQRSKTYGKKMVKSSEWLLPYIAYIVYTYGEKNTLKNIHRHTHRHTYHKYCVHICHRIYNAFLPL